MSFIRPIEQLFIEIEVQPQYTLQSATRYKHTLFCIVIQLYVHALFPFAFLGIHMNLYSQTSCFLSQQVSLLPVKSSNFLKAVP